MPELNLIPEQLAVIDAAVSTKDNLLVNALAGAAKTTTLVELASALPDVDILSLAFNKKIAEEMKVRLPANCDSSTINALGHRVWAGHLRKRLRVNMRKMYDLTIDYFDSLAPSAKETLSDSFREVLATAKEAKSAGYIPEAWTKKAPDHLRVKPLLSSSEFYSSCEFDLGDVEQEAVDSILSASLDLALEGDIDFDDQVLMPSCFKCRMPMYKLVLVDEAQDLSALNHRFLEKLARFRLIAVGDPCQAIYGFRGAHENSMSQMRSAFSMHELSLPVSFRCPEPIVEHVRWRAPNMRSWDGNPHNTVSTVRSRGAWSIEDVPDGAAVICRNNAPLFRLALLFLRNGRYPKLLKGDIVAALIGHMKKLGAKSMQQDDVLDAIKKWEAERLKRSRAHATIRDQAECMRIFANEGETLGAAIQIAVDITEQHGAIDFMTGHKSKGLEYDEVFFLDEDLVGDEGQERNLRYVICTRALKNLTYIKSSACLEAEAFEDVA